MAARARPYSGAPPRSGSRCPLRQFCHWCRDRAGSLASQRAVSGASRTRVSRLIEAMFCASSALRATSRETIARDRLRHHAPPKCGSVLRDSIRAFRYYGRSTDHGDFAAPRLLQHLAPSISGTTNHLHRRKRRFHLAPRRCFGDGGVNVNRRARTFVDRAVPDRLRRPRCAPPSPSVIGATARGTEPPRGSTRIPPNVPLPRLPAPARKSTRPGAAEHGLNGTRRWRRSPRR